MLPLRKSPERVGLAGSAGIRHRRGIIKVPWQFDATSDNDSQITYDVNAFFELKGTSVKFRR